jgi:cytochrome c-type biogenesis protein CcmH
MMRPLFVAACVAALGLGWVIRAQAIDPATMSDPALQARYIELIHEFRCMQCQNETLADSPVGLAGDLRREIRELLQAGKSDEDIRNYLVGRYGEFILFKPRFNWKTAWLWMAPFVLLLIGAAIAIRVLRQRARLVDADPFESIDP